jgi:hypothetical protein
MKSTYKHISAAILSALLLATSACAPDDGADDGSDYEDFEAEEGAAEEGAAEEKTGTLTLYQKCALACGDQRYQWVKENCNVPEQTTGKQWCANRGL